MEDRRVLVERVGYVEDGREVFVLHLDEVDGALGDVLIVGRDGRHPLAKVADDRVREDGHVFDATAVEVSPDVGARDHREHAGQALGLAGVDADDAGVRTVAVQHLPPHGSRQRVVGSVASPTGSLLHPLDTRRRRANRLVVSHDAQT